MFPLFFHISLSFAVCFKNKYQSVLCVAHTCVPFSSANFNESHMNIVCVVYCYSITLYARATGWVLLRCAVDCFCYVHFNSVDRWSKGQKWNLLPIIYLLLRIRFGSNQYARVLNHSHTYTHISTIRQMSIFQMLFVNDDEFSVFDRLIFNNILNFIYRFFTTSWTH